MKYYNNNKPKNKRFYNKIPKNKRQNNNSNDSVTAALLAYKLKQYGEAILILENAPNAHKTDMLYSTLGNCYNKLKNICKAQENYELALKLNPKNKFSMLALGKIYAKQGKENGAKKLFKECLRLNPQDLHARFELGRLYAKQGNQQKAEKLFKECLRLNPQDLHARLELGKLYGKQKKEQKAEKLFKEYMILGPQNAHARFELGKLYVKQGKKQEGEKLFKECLELDSQDLYAKLELAIMYKGQGREEEAASLYKYIFKDLNIKDYENYDNKSRKKHVEHHLKNDLSKEKHGVFNLSIKEIKEKVDFSKAKKQVAYKSDIYCVKMENCGYEGGYKGDGHQLDYLTIVTFPGKLDIITMFPSDEIIVEKGKKVVKQQGKKTNDFERD